MCVAKSFITPQILVLIRSVRLQVVGVVVDDVLYESGISKDTSLKRAKAILTIAGIFKSVEADESDEERRELERLVMNAGNKKKAEREQKEKEKKGWGWGKHAEHGAAEMHEAEKVQKAPASASASSEAAK